MHGAELCWWQNIVTESLEAKRLPYSQARFTTTIMYHAEHVLYTIFLYFQAFLLTSSMHDVRETGHKTLFPKRRDNIFWWWWQWWCWYNTFSVFRIHFKTNHAQFDVSLFSTFMHGITRIYARGNCSIWHIGNWVEKQRCCLGGAGGGGTHHEDWKQVPFEIKIRNSKTKGWRKRQN